jgi:hypothetical protein
MFRAANKSIKSKITQKNVLRIRKKTIYLKSTPIPAILKFKKKWLTGNKLSLENKKNTNSLKIYK